MANTPLPRTEPSSSRIQLQRNWTLVIAEIFLGILTFPYRRTFKLYTWKPLKAIRAADGDRQTSVSLIKEWKNDKYQELQSVQVASSFCAGANLAVFSWQHDPKPIWPTSAFFYCSLICSIWAVITSIQVKSVLDDLPNKEELTEDMPEYEFKRTRRVILRYKKKPGLAHGLMMFVWQFPSMQMSYAWVFFITGLSVYVLTPFIRNERWGDDAKIAIVYFSVGGVGLLAFLFLTVFVYAGEKEQERSAASTRVNTFGSAPRPSLATAEEDAEPGPRRESKDPAQTLRNRALLINGSTDGVHRSQTFPPRKRVLLI